MTDQKPEELNENDLKDVTGGSLNFEEIKTTKSPGKKPGKKPGDKGIVWTEIDQI